MYDWYIDLRRLILAPLFLGLPLVILIWAFWRWSRTSPRIVQPAWRSYIALAAIGLGAFSSLLWVILILWARAIGGFPFYDPMVLSFYRWGFLTGAAGFAISFAGKGKLRWPSCGLSILMALLWMMAATTE